MTIISKDELLARRNATPTGFPEEDVPIEGGSVRVRGLSRWDYLAIAKAKDQITGECMGISLALIEPQLSVADVKEWMKGPFGHEILDIGKVVSRLSKTEKDSAKESYKEFEADSAKEFEFFPGAEAGQDGGTAEGANQ